MRILVVHSLNLRVDARKNDPVAEARAVVAAINEAIAKLPGDPCLDFDLQGSADIDASYEAGEGDKEDV